MVDAPSEWRKPCWVCGHWEGGFQCTCKTKFTFFWAGGQAGRQAGRRSLCLRSLLTKLRNCCCGYGPTKRLVNTVFVFFWFVLSLFCCGIYTLYNKFTSTGISCRRSLTMPPTASAIPNRWCQKYQSVV